MNETSNEVHVAAGGSVDRPTASPAEPTLWLTHQWIMAGIVASAARFIPVPFVDDLVKSQCRKFAASRTLAYHQSGVKLEDLKPYYAAGGGLTEAIAGAPLKLLLFPIRKIVAVASSIRGVPLDIMRTVLFARTLDRVLRDGRLTKLDHDPVVASRKLRVAFDRAFSGMDFHVVKAAVNDALGSVNDWKIAAVELARKAALRSQSDATGLDDITPREKESIASSADRVQEVFARPETLELFVKFDARFDESLGLPV